MVPIDPAAELFDVVDERDQVVGRAPRREVHARGLRHRAVHVLVFNDAGEVFLQQRSHSKDTAPGLWDSSASGHLNAGEEYDTAAVRELEEEIGLRVPRPPARWIRLPACAENGQEFVWIYRLASAGPLTLNRDEIDRGVWLSPREITRLVREKPGDYSSSFRLIWRTLADRGEVPG